MMNLHAAAYQHYKEGLMAEQKKKDALKNIMINLGILLILVGATAVKGDNLTFFFLGLSLLAIQTFTLPGADQKKLVMAEIMISGTLSIAAITQLIMARSFGTPQVFLVVLLLGGILVIVESVRKYAELE
jgi:hypothetical protein